MSLYGMRAADDETLDETDARFEASRVNIRPIPLSETRMALSHGRVYSGIVGSRESYGWQ